MMELTTAQTLEMILHCCDAIMAKKDYLTEVDSAIGDGDHGIGMAGGMQKAADALKKKAVFENVNEIFKVTGMSILSSMGGASGVIFGTMFLGGIKGMEPIQTLNAAAMAQIMRGSLDAICQRGKAQEGDKTMVDALAPAVRALEANGEQDLTVAMEAAAAAAAEGSEKTREYVAKFGRSRYVGERALGHLDAGSVSVSILFAAMKEYLNTCDQ